MEEKLRQRAKPRLLRVTMPNGEVLCYNRATHTFIEALRRISPDNYSKIKLESKGLPFFSKTIHPRFKDSMVELCDGWYVLNIGDSSEKYMQLRSIAQQLGIKMNVEIGHDFESESLQKGRQRRGHMKMLAKFPNGTTIEGENPIDVFMETIKVIGPDVIKRKELEWMGKPIVTLTKVYNGQVQVGQNLWLIVPGTTADKCRLLRAISTQMKLNLEVTIK